MHRRELLQGTLAAATSGTLGCAGAPPATPETIAPTGSASADPDQFGPLDAALVRLHQSDPEFGNGLSNHGPMACEALEVLGAPGRIADFEAKYSTRLEPMTSSQPVPFESWTGSLGKPDARAGLIEMFEAQLAGRGPNAVLAEVLPVLGPGLIGAAFHGVLRAAHAYRGWTRHASTPRQTELAHGLGYWAARHQPLPGRPGAQASAGLGVLEALASVPIVPKGQRADGLIFERFAVLQGNERFTAAVQAFDPMAASPDEVIDALASVSAQLYLTTPDPRSRFVYLHGVTGSAAVRQLLPALAPQDRQPLATALFHAIAAVHATHGDPGFTPGAWAETVHASADDLALRATQSQDDHTIKLVEAAVREFRRSDRPEFLAVAAHRLGDGA